MTAAEAVDDDGNPCPIEIAFGEGGIPADCQVSSNRVRCTPLDHHADPISVQSGVKIVTNSSHNALQGGGMVTAKNIVQPVYQLKSEFQNRVGGGFFAEVMTEDHNAYPLTVFYGFTLQSAVEEFRFASSVQQKVENHFDVVEVVNTSSTRITVLTSTDPFPHQFVDSLRE